MVRLNDDVALEAQLERRLRAIDLERLHPGLPERAWAEFCVLAGIEHEPSPARPGEPAPLPARELGAREPAPAADAIQRLGFARAPQPAFSARRPATSH
jgi:hypothetical protein